MRTKIESGVEYFLAVVFLYGAFDTLLEQPTALPGVFTLLVGQYAIYVYAAIFLVIGGMLLYAKIRQNKVIHKYALLFMYLTCFYFLTLSVAVNGFGASAIQLLLVGAVSGYLWLRWKFLTEYIDPHMFSDDIKYLGE